jgi:hypothetical protein
MAKYRVLEISDKLINGGKPRWRVEKLRWGLWWDQYFEEHSEDGATFYSKEEALRWYEYHCDNSSRYEIKIISES